MKLLKDRYFLLCFAACFILIIFSLSYSETKESENTDTISGVIVSVNETSKGFTFNLKDFDDNNVYCFFKTEPIVNKIYYIQGSFSEDRTIFFVSDMSICE